MKEVFVLSYLSLNYGEIADSPKILLFSNEDSAKEYAVKEYYHKEIINYLKDEEFRDILKSLPEALGIDGKNLFSGLLNTVGLARLFVKNYEAENWRKAYDTARALHQEEPLSFILNIEKQNIIEG